MAAARQFGLFSGKAEAPSTYGRARHSSPRANGYAAMPGTGPQGESCGTCAHCRMRTIRSGRHYYKCALMLERWSSCRSTDVVLRSPACSRWQSGKPLPTTIVVNPND